MLNGFINRENEIFDIINRLKNEKVDIILIGGYAVSAFKHRFSVDADIVVEEGQLSSITNILDRSGFEHYKSMNLEDTYQGKFKAFIKKTGLPITVDLLINSVTSRQTNASWSFGLFKENSVEKEVNGVEKSIKARIPIRELLIATKIHACRLTDVRDIVAICDKVDISRVIGFAKRGDLNKLKECVLRFKSIVKNKDFIDAFKGVFSIEKFPKNNVDYANEIVNGLLDALNKT